MPDISRNRIEIWRSEVESQTSSQSGVTGDVGWNAPVVRPTSFWRRLLLGFGFGSNGSGDGDRGGNGSGSGSGSSRSVSIGRKFGLVKGEIERTGMYTAKTKDNDKTGSGRALNGRGTNREGDGGSSMELDGSEESARGGLRERRNRLERAAKLLGKTEGPGENRQRS